MSTKPQKLPVFNTDKETADFLLSNLTDTLKQAIRFTVKVMIRQEMDQLREEMKEKLSFNGYYNRQMLCGLGKIENVPVARFRERQVSDLPLNSLSLFDQEKEKFLALIAEIHRLGISDRKVEKLCQSVFGMKFSKNRVSAVHKELAEEESLQINRLPIADEFEYLIIDGIWVKTKNFGLKDNNKTVLLCALGITKAGERKIIGFTPADREDYESWRDFILSLKERGLTDKGLKLIIADDNGGLTKAVGHLFPQTKLQVCMAHKTRNVMGKTSWKNKAAIAKDLKKIYDSESKEEAMRNFKACAKKWYVAEPKAVASLRFDFEKTLTYYEFDKELWKKIRTSNILEREFREVRRRIKVFDNSFNDRDSLMRYGNTIFDYLNNNYPAYLHTKS